GKSRRDQVDLAACLFELAALIAELHAEMSAWIEWEVHGGVQKPVCTVREEGVEPFIGGGENHTLEPMWHENIVLDWPDAQGEYRTDSQNVVSDCKNWIERSVHTLRVEEAGDGIELPGQVWTQAVGRRNSPFVADRLPFRGS